MVTAEGVDERRAVKKLGRPSGIHMCPTKKNVTTLLHVPLCSPNSEIGYFCY